MNAPKNNTAVYCVDTEAPVWALEMQHHYSHTGCYRVEDLQKILGDPRESVTSAASEDCQMSPIYKNYLSQY